VARHRPLKPPCCAASLGAHQHEHYERRTDLLLGFLRLSCALLRLKHQSPGCLGACDSGCPGGMLAFILKKFVGSYLALRAVSRVHCWPV
jgi:hypothetical protein